MARKTLTRPWTAEETVILEKLVRDGKSPAQIARHLRRSADAVKRRVRPLKRKSALNEGDPSHG